MSNDPCEYKDSPSDVLDRCIYERDSKFKFIELLFVIQDSTDN